MPDGFASRGLGSVSGFFDPVTRFLTAFLAKRRAALAETLTSETTSTISLTTNHRLAKKVAMREYSHRLTVSCSDTVE